MKAAIAAIGLTGAACGLASAAAQGYLPHGLWRSALREASGGTLAGLGAAVVGVVLLRAVFRPAAPHGPGPRGTAGASRRGLWWGAAGLLLALLAGGAAATLVAARMPSGFLTGPTSRVSVLSLPFSAYRFSVVPFVAAVTALTIPAAGRLIPSLPRTLAWTAGPLAVLLAVAGPAARLAPAGGETPADILFVSIDTLRADRLGSYGYPRDTSPTLDRLAAEGYLFETVTSQAPNTDPSHASMLSGLDPPRHGNLLNGDILPTRILTLAEMLRERGYATRAVVGGLTLQANLCGLDQGFDDYDDRFSGTLRPAGTVTDRALAALSGVPAGRPLFLFVHYYDVHGPYDPPAPFREFFASGPAPVGGERSIDPEDLPRYQRFENTRSARFYLDGYDAEIRHVDSQIARLIEGMKEAGRFDGTWTVVVSDHGESLLERSRFFHHGALLTEEQILIPLIVRPPGGLPVPSTVTVPVQSTDLTPFLLDATDAPRPRGIVFDGRSFLDILESPDGAATAGGDTRLSFAVARCAPWQLPGFPVRLDREGLLMSLRTDRLKLVRYPGLDGPYHALYDLREDPAEMRDIAGSEPVLVSDLAARLDAWAGAADADPTPRRGMDETTRDLLESLGYVD